MEIVDIKALSNIHLVIFGKTIFIIHVKCVRRQKNFCGNFFTSKFSLF
jgi:hypothetical protein